MPWTCRKCRTRHPTYRTQLCTNCGKRRPPKKYGKDKIQSVDLPYAEYARLNGSEYCWICVRLGTVNPTHKLYRDHDHNTGAARGLLCFRHNIWVKRWCTPENLRVVLEYVERDDRTTKTASRMR